jgi:hypothetical protein
MINMFFCHIFVFWILFLSTIDFLFSYILSIQQYSSGRGCLRTRKDWIEEKLKMNRRMSQSLRGGDCEERLREAFVVLPIGGSVYLIISGARGLKCVFVVGERRNG